MSKKGFFAVSLPVLHRILEQGGDAGDLIVYLVLANHTTGWGKWKYQTSTAGASAMNRKTGVTYEKAKLRLNWLQEQGFIQSGEAVKGVPSPVPSGAKRQRDAIKVQWVLGKLGSKGRVYLAHSLIEGVGQGKKNRPLVRLWEEIKTGPCATIMDARTDAFLLLMHCYVEQSIQDYGGINPSVLRNEWQEGEPLDVLDVPLDNALVMELEQPEGQAGETASLAFIERVLPYVSKDDRPKRFWNAFNNLKRLGFMYEVIEVWHDNPLENPRAELFYPLYIRDYHARQSEPYCQRDIHGFLDTARYLDGFAMHELLKEAQERETFRLIRTEGGKECAIGTYRLRFRPSTEDTGKGMKQEAERAEHWKQVLERAAIERGTG
jgi:hypothetical protein